MRARRCPAPRGSASFGLASFSLALMTNVPAFADAATSAGAKALETDLAAYFGKAAIDRGIIAVTPKGDAYELTFDPQPAIDGLKLPQGSFQVGRSSYLVAPAPNGTWKVTSDDFPSISMRVPSQQGEVAETIAAVRPHFEGVFDTKLGGFSSLRITVDALTVTGKGQGMDIDLRLSEFALDGEGTAAGDDAMTARVRQTIKSMAENVTVVPAAKPGAPSPVPITITYNIGPSTGDSTVEEMRAKSLQALWAFLVANGADGLAAHQDELKATLRAALPIWKNIEAKAQIADLVGRTPVGSFTIKSFTENLGLSGFVPQGGGKIGLKLEGLSVASPLMPSWAGPILPNAAHLDVSFPLAGLDKVAALMIDELDLNSSPPLSEATKAEAAGILMSGAPKLVIAPGRLASSSYTITYSGELALGGPKPTGHLMIEAEGLDKTSAALREAAKTDPRAQQAAGAIDVALSFARPGADGKLSWSIDFGEDGATSINGMKLGQPNK